MDKHELKRLIIEQQEEKNALIRHLIDQGLLNKRVRANREETNLAYQYVLETAEDASEALQMVSIDKGKSEDWVDKVKHSPVYKSNIDNAIKNSKDNSVFINMNKSGVWNKGSKRSLRQASTLSSMLNTLSDYVQLHNRVENLENITKALIDHAMVTDDRLNNLESKIDTKDKALQLLKTGGYSIAEVSKIVGKHRNTVTKWRKELDNES
jgi:hypothetical protein